MRAVTQNALGGPEVLEVAETERPRPQAGEVLVRVHASALNPVDAAVRSGFLPLLGEPPFGIGWDVSGVVEEAAEGAGFAVGDEVYGMPLFPRAAGGYAEYVAVPARHLARRPVSLDHTHAAALPLAGLTAWQSLVGAAEVKAGDRVLIHRAAGGVGHLAVQIAKARGAHVIALASEAKHEFVRGLGADEVVDYRTTDFTEAFKDLDVVLDSSAEGDRSLRVLRPGGMLVSIMQHRDQELAARVRAAGRRFAGVSVEPDAAGLAGIAALVDSGRLRPHVAAAFPLEDVATAHELLGTGRTQGKIVLTVRDEPAV
ncbi:NADP-dependent oxidoreductase [Streptomyces sp. UNOB3_S3]|uniref:NADP-dependent oxidoreductase n=1 Tax=Streptomyces sp. UNOB3_S3 TaxID=2871682 RepID=UPI001E574A58|nr:NADP-dependent oxidoreductase [Streptomyces sp. UNOB3_S3]MCC3777671.1 NADP-dependent oxidoreductase [Streptomyces sp. UNOB3_S3]